MRNPKALSTVIVTIFLLFVFSTSYGQFILPPNVLGNDTTICTAFSHTLSTGNPCTLWSTGVTASQITVTTAGTYWASIPDSCGTGADTIRISDGTIDLGRDTSICGLVPLQLRAYAGNGATYIWQDNSTDSTYNVLYTGSYSVTATTACGTATDRIYIESHPDECRLMIPTAFSPNSDGMNDLFRAVSRCGADKYELNIYNRWGELVYSTTDIFNAWDGQYKGVAQPLGVYTYYYKYINYCDKQLTTGGGNVTLVR